MKKRIIDDPESLYNEMRKVHRNVYEPSELYEQNRRSVEDFIENLRYPGFPEDSFHINGDQLENVHGSVTIENDVVDFTGINTSTNVEWKRLNAQFLNYHKSLTIYEIMNSLAISNYLSIVSGIGDLKNKTVVDVGAGTGHVFCSFFRYPETIEYYLVDPNLRLLHDFFLRMFPKLALHKVAHILSYAEQIPLKSNFADVVMSMAAIDHYNDYEKFISEAYRVLKSDGIIFIASHLDIPAKQKVPNAKVSGKIVRFLERLTRFLYVRQNKVGRDDHTFHFENTEPIVKCLKNVGFEIVDDVTFDANFYIKAKKAN